MHAWGHRVQILTGRNKVDIEVSVYCGICHVQSCLAMCLTIFYTSSFSGIDVAARVYSLFGNKSRFQHEAHEQKPCNTMYAWSEKNEQSYKWKVQMPCRTWHIQLKEMFLRILPEVSLPNSYKIDSLVEGRLCWGSFFEETFTNIVFFRLWFMV